MSARSQKIAIYFLLVLIISAGAYLRFYHFHFDASVDRSPDEPMYNAYASVLAHEGLVKGTRISIEQFNRNEKLWIYPSPLRVGYLGLLASAMKCQDRFEMDVGIRLSGIISVLALVLLAAIALRFFNPAVAFFAALFMAFSPMELFLSGKVLADGLLTLVSGMLVFLCLEISERPGRKILYFLFALIGGYCLLIKTAGALVFGFCVIWLIASLFSKKRVREARALLFIVLATVTGSVLFLTGLTGSPEKVLEVYRNAASAVSQNDYVAQYQTGPWYSVLEGFFLATPFVAVFALMGIICGLVFARRQSWLAVIFILVSFILAGSASHYFKSLRIMSPVYIPFYLLSGSGAVWTMSHFLKFRKPFSFFAVAVFLSAILEIPVFDYHRFDRVFIKNHSKDLVNGLIRKNL